MLISLNYFFTFFKVLRIFNTTCDCVDSSLFIHWGLALYFFDEFFLNPIIIISFMYYLIKYKISFIVLSLWLIIIHFKLYIFFNLSFKSYIRNINIIIYTSKKDEFIFLKFYLANISFIKNDDINKNNIKDTFFIYLEVKKFKMSLNDSKRKWYLMNKR